MTARTVLVEDRRDIVIEGDDARLCGRLRPALTSSSAKGHDEQQENCADAHNRDHINKKPEAERPAPGLSCFVFFVVEKLFVPFVIRSRSSLRSPRSAAS